MLQTNQIEKPRCSAKIDQARLRRAMNLPLDSQNFASSGFQSEIQVELSLLMGVVSFRSSWVQTASQALRGLGGQLGEIGLGCRRLHSALFSDDVGEAAIDIARHPLGIAADIEMRAVFEPRPQLDGVLQEPVLDVDLVLLVARKGGVEPGQQPAVMPRGQLV